MTRLMSLILFLILAFLATACAPLSKHESVLGDAGEVIGRTLLCPVTFCFSEIGFYNNWKLEQEKLEYSRWYNALSDDEKNFEDLRQAHRYQLMGMIMHGRQFQPMTLTPSAPFAPMHSINEGTLPPRQRTNCVSNAIGNQVHTNCY